MFGNTNLLQTETTDYEPSVGRSRPGPRPTRGPASTPRRQSNRESQRAHRRRKERYVKDLELEVGQLRRQLAELAQEHSTILHENRRLQEINEELREASSSSRLVSTTFAEAVNQERRGTSGSASSVLRTDPNSFTSQDSSTSQSSTASHDGPGENFTHPVTGTLDFDAIAVDFVTSLESPCMKHIRYLVARANNALGVSQERPNDVPNDGENEDISGHALMVTCPTPEQVEYFPDNAPLNESLVASNTVLTKLKELSSKLPDLTVQELPPIKVWERIRRDARSLRFNVADFQQLREQLLPCVRCFRFGAIVHACDVDHAMERICNG